MARVLGRPIAGAGPQVQDLLAEVVLEFIDGAHPPVQSIQEYGPRRPLPSTADGRDK